jgi:hypothetical protein
MPLTKPMSDAGKVAAVTPPDRDRAVDVARLAALVVVMFGHCALATRHHRQQRSAHRRTG